MRDKFYVNEIFVSPQGEGGRAGEISCFVRFAGCNLRCSMEPGEKSPGGFDCDTEFESGVFHTLDSLLKTIDAAAYHRANWVVFTGGEPALQLTKELIEGCHYNGLMVAVETNGSVALPEGIDWITVSPKMAEHTLRQLTANEVKYVRHAGQGIPQTRVEAKLKWLSPAYGFNGKVDEGALRTCLQLIRDHPEWRISQQQHKQWGVR